MGIIIDGNINVGSSGISISPPYVEPPVSFNFTFNQEFGDTAIIIQSIGGFTSTPAFTSTASPFIFNSTGTSPNPVTFNFTVSRPGFVSVQQTFELRQNSAVLQSINVAYGVFNPQTITFNPIIVSTNDSIVILGYRED
jgi:hypothetical protein